MRRIVVSTYVTLDGVFEEPAWSAPYWSDEAQKFARDQLWESDALLLGRTTYEEFASAWPTVLVLEANNRVGGRTLNADIGSGRKLEMGGQWMGELQGRRDLVGAILLAASKLGSEVSDARGRANRERVERLMSSAHDSGSEPGKVVSLAANRRR